MKDFIKRFKNLSLGCPEEMPLSILLQTCKYNLRAEIEIYMGPVRAHTWKELQEQSEVIEKLKIINLR